MDCEPKGVRKAKLEMWINAHEKEIEFLDKIIKELDDFYDTHNMVVHGLSDVITNLKEIANRTNRDLRIYKKELEELKWWKIIF